MKKKVELKKVMLRFYLNNRRILFCAMSLFLMCQTIEVNAQISEKEELTNDASSISRDQAIELFEINYALQKEDWQASLDGDF